MTNQPMVLVNLTNKLRSEGATTATPDVEIPPDVTGEKILANKILA